MTMFGRSRTAQNVCRWCSVRLQGAHDPGLGESDRRPRPESVRWIDKASRGRIRPGRWWLLVSDASDGARTIAARSWLVWWLSHDIATFARISADAEVGNTLIERQTVQWGMRLDEPPMSLCFEIPRTSLSGLVDMSSQGERRSSGRSKVGDWNTRSAHIIWVQVVPHFVGVLITMSSGRNSNPSHLRLSRTNWR